MTPQTGTPPTDGRYIVYVEGKAGALEPWVTLWQDGAWRYKRSTAIFDGQIHYWIGPLPELTKKPKVEFDL